MDTAALWKKLVIIFIFSFAALSALLFVPAGTLGYWQAWAYLATLIVPMVFVVAYFMKTDPEFLERRMRTKEKEAAQKFVTAASAVIFLVGFVIPGLDHRFGWSSMPSEVAIGADAVVFAGYVIVAIVLKENRFAGRTIQTEKGQKVISSGLYGIVRHPMYVGMLMIYIATPLALGSYAAFPVFLLMVPLIVIRILNEEEVLRRELKGYNAYCKKTPYRLIPFVW